MVELKDTVISLLLNGFHIDKVERVTSSTFILNFHKYDNLGAKIDYSLLLCNKDLKGSYLSTLDTYSSKQNATKIVVSKENPPDDVLSFTPEGFFNSIGGYIDTGLILIPQLHEFLQKLGHNKLPEELSGSPDDLLELYSKSCLQYILNSKGVHYGTDRLFESLPDGVILGKDKMIIQFDSKAYSGGFKFSADDIKRFARYIQEFNSKYENLLGSVFTFLVISGHFEDSERSLNRRSKELYSLCQTNLSVLNCEELASITTIIKNNPECRNSINWHNIFSEMIIESSLIEEQIDQIKKDKIL